MTPLAVHIQQFLEYLEIERGRSTKTVENYSHYLQRFFRWLAEKTGRKPEALALADMTEEAIRQYRLWMNRLTPSLSPATQNYHVIALRMFLKHLARRGVQALPADRLELMRHPDRTVAFLESDEVERLLAAPSGNGLREVRDRAILETLFSTGLRVSELVGLDINTINTDRGEFSVRGKGGKVRVVFLSERAKKGIGEWITARREIVEPALFTRIPRGTGKNFSRLTPRSVQRIVEHYTKKAGIVGKDVHPHTLRHSYATDLLRNGADLRSVQALLGHASITTTQVYTHVTDPQLRDVHRRFHGKRRSA